jgi:hypothetical protein
VGGQPLPATLVCDGFLASSRYFWPTTSSRTRRDGLPPHQTFDKNKKLMKKIALLLFIPLLSLTSCNSDKKESATSRYSTQTFSVAGGMAVITQITDHESNTIYYYKLDDKKGLTLQSTIDLTKAGDKNIPFESNDKDKSKTEE